MLAACELIKHCFSYGNCIDNNAGLQFGEISIFQHWFPKSSNSFVMNRFSDVPANDGFMQYN